MALKVPRNPQSGSPPGQFRSVTPSDGSDLPERECGALTCLVAGSASVIGAHDTDAVTVALVPGGWLPGRFRRVRATGTTATGIVAAY
jgi:hypothetical protein